MKAKLLIFSVIALVALSGCICTPSNGLYIQIESKNTGEVQSVNLTDDYVGTVILGSAGGKLLVNYTNPVERILVNETYTKEEAVTRKILSFKPEPNSKSYRVNLPACTDKVVVKLIRDNKIVGVARVNVSYATERGDQ